MVGWVELLLSHSSMKILDCDSRLKSSLALTRFALADNTASDSASVLTSVVDPAFLQNTANGDDIFHSLWLHIFFLIKIVRRWLQMPSVCFRFAKFLNPLQYIKLCWPFPIKGAHLSWHWCSWFYMFSFCIGVDSWCTFRQLNFYRISIAFIGTIINSLNHSKNESILGWSSKNRE